MGCGAVGEGHDAVGEGDVVRHSGAVICAVTLRHLYMRVSGEIFNDRRWKRHRGVVGSVRLLGRHASGQDGRPCASICVITIEKYGVASLFVYIMGFVIRKERNRNRRRNKPLFR
jgi:hypothetical protein